MATRIIHAEARRATSLCGLKHVWLAIGWTRVTCKRCRRLGNAPKSN